MRVKPVVIAALFLTIVHLLGCASMRAAQLYQSGTRALNAGDGELAVHQLRLATELEPAASEIQNHLGLAYTVAGQPGRALAAFERAVELDCENAAATSNLAAARAAATEPRPPASTQTTGDP